MFVLNFGRSNRTNANKRTIVMFTAEQKQLQRPHEIITSPKSTVLKQRCSTREIQSSYFRRARCRHKNNISLALIILFILQKPTKAKSRGKCSVLVFPRDFFPQCTFQTLLDQKIIVVYESYSELFICTALLS